MNEIVSFTKEIEFNTDIDKITSISIEHTICLDKDNVVKGDLILTGTYRINQITQIDSPFSYKIPIDIVLDSKYDLSNMTIDIDNFTYDILDNKKLKVDVDLILDKLEKLEKNDEILDVNDLFLEKEDEKDLSLIKDDEKNTDEFEEAKEETNQNESLFSNINSTNESYSTYSVYIMNENDSIETVMEKYKVSKKQLEDYNNLNDLKRGTKVIVPNNNE